MYSLLSAPALGFDLARIPGGSEVARVLVEGMGLRPADVDAVGRYYVDDPDRDDAWLAIMHGTAGRSGIGDAMAAAVGSAGGDDAETLTDRVTRLAVTPIGTLDDVLRLVREEILGWALLAGLAHAEPAAALLCDAAAAGYVSEALGEVHARRLRAPWRRAVRRVSAPSALDHRAADVASRLSRLTALDVGRLQVEVDAERRRSTGWPSSMHAAAALVASSGRLRPAAAAQLDAVRRLALAGVDARLVATGVWSAVSARVQAAYVRDLDAPLAARLSRPWKRATD